MDTARTETPLAPVMTPASTDPGAHKAIVSELKRMIAQELDVRIEEKDIDPAIPLLEGGLTLDSMVLFELITLIEKRFGVAFSTESLNTEVFANLNGLAQHILASMPRAEAGGGAAQ